MNIKNSVIIITGASMGIGAAAARALYEKGATVVLAARSKDKLDDLQKELEASPSKLGVSSLVVPTDMISPKSIKSLIAKTHKKFGRIDVLINNAGQGLYSPVELVDPKEYQKIIDLNIMGPMIAMQEVIPLMRVQGGGVIVNISSIVSKNYYPNLGAYASTKYALNALSLTARQELEKDNIIVSVVHRDSTATEFGKNSIKSKNAESIFFTKTAPTCPYPTLLNMSPTKLPKQSNPAQRRRICTRRFPTPP